MLLRCIEITGNSPISSLTNVSVILGFRKVADLLGVGSPIFLLALDLAVVFGLVLLVSLKTGGVISFPWLNIFSVITHFVLSQWVIPVLQWEFRWWRENWSPVIWFLGGFAFKADDVKPSPGWRRCFRSSTSAVPVRSVSRATWANCWTQPHIHPNSDSWQVWEEEVSDALQPSNKHCFPLGRSWRWTFKVFHLGLIVSLEKVIWFS